MLDMQNMLDVLCRNRLLPRSWGVHCVKRFNGTGYNCTTILDNCTARLTIVNIISLLLPQEVSGSFENLLKVSTVMSKFLRLSRSFYRALLYCKCFLHRTLRAIHHVSATTIFCWRPTNQPFSQQNELMKFRLAKPARRLKNGPNYFWSNIFKSVK